MIVECDLGVNTALSLNIVLEWILIVECDLGVNTALSLNIVLEWILIVDCDLGVFSHLLIGGEPERAPRGHMIQRHPATQCVARSGSPQLFRTTYFCFH